MLDSGRRLLRVAQRGRRTLARARRAAFSRAVCVCRNLGGGLCDRHVRGARRARRSSRPGAGHSRAVNYDEWLSDETPIERLRALTVRALPDDDLEFYDVSKLVNSPKNETPEVIERVESPPALRLF